MLAFFATSIAGNVLMIWTSLSNSKMQPFTRLSNCGNGIDMKPPDVCSSFDTSCKVTWGLMGASYVKIPSSCAKTARKNQNLIYRRHVLLCRRMYHCENVHALPRDPVVAYAPNLRFIRFVFPHILTFGGGKLHRTIVR